MPLSYAELERFYESLVARARRRGIACAITSAMAGVAFGVEQATRDCDLLCAPAAAGKLLELLGKARLHGQLPSYRGHLTPPLDARWLRGGWTSHFVWEAAGAEAYLDVFGVAPRGSSSWEAELQVPRMIPGFMPSYTRKFSSGTNSTGRVCAFMRRRCGLT